jgi:hypothetical protein
MEIKVFCPIYYNLMPYIMNIYDFYVYFIYFKQFKLMD